MSLTIFISGNVPSSKNSMVWTGRFLVKSKTCQRYIKSTKDQWMAHGAIFRAQFDIIPKPARISFKFIRNSKHRFDYHNMIQVLADLMTQYGWIPDDNSDEMIPVFEPYEYNPENPGVYISIYPSP